MALFKKNKESKKGQESAIGKIIYGFLLFAPFLSILTTSMYVIFNKNAYQSYYGQEINEKQEVQITSNNQIQFDETYNYYSELALNQTYSGNIYYSSCKYISSSTVQTQENIDFINNSVRVYFYRGTSQTFYDSENNSLLVTGQATVQLNGIIQQGISSSAYQVLKKIEYNKYSYLDNAFDYGMYKTEQNNVFNWAKNTGTYTVLQNTCIQLGITNTFTPMLMAYWLLISVIYFIFDIALILIWMVHNKIHELQESI